MKSWWALKTFKIFQNLTDHKLLNSSTYELYIDTFLCLKQFCSVTVHAPAQNRSVPIYHDNVVFTFSRIKSIMALMRRTIRRKMVKQRFHLHLHTSPWDGRARTRSPLTLTLKNRLSVSFPQSKKTNRHPTLMKWTNPQSSTQRAQASRTNKITAVRPFQCRPLVRPERRSQNLALSIKWCLNLQIPLRIQSRTTGKLWNPNPNRRCVNFSWAKRRRPTCSARIQTLRRPPRLLPPPPPLPPSSTKQVRRRATGVEAPRPRWAFGTSTTGAAWEGRANRHLPHTRNTERCALSFPHGICLHLDCSSASASSESLLQVRSQHYLASALYNTDCLKIFRVNKQDFL